MLKLSVYVQDMSRRQFEELRDLLDRLKIEGSVMEVDNLRELPEALQDQHLDLDDL